jgi:hypothetical protein
MMLNTHNSEGTKKISLSLRTVDTDWVDAGPCIVNSEAASQPVKGSTVVRDKVWWRRRGDSMEVRMEYYQTTGGSAGGNGIYFVQIPSGYTIDLSKITTQNATANMANTIGTFSAHTGGSNRLHGGVHAYDATHVSATYIGYNGGTDDVDESGWGNSSGSAVNATFGSSGLRFSMIYTIPILGWSTHDAAANIVGPLASKTDLESENAGKTVTANNVRFNPGVAKAWVTFNASTGVPIISSSFNVSSITDNGVGLYTINFNQPFNSVNYTVSGSARYNSAPAAAIAYVGLRRQTTDAKTTSTCAIQVVYNAGNAVAIAYDSPEVTVIFHGNQ